MGKEITKHIQHLGVTFDRLLQLLGIDALLDINPPAELMEKALAERVAWIRTSELAVPGVTTELMALHHLLWFQQIGSIVIEDDDPFSGAVKIRVLPPRRKETVRNS